jgi:hypothetical protein
MPRSKSKSKGKSKACPKGKIMRKGYTRKDGSRVKRSCVKDMGKPGKGPKTLPKIEEEGLLRTYGYKLSDNAAKRKAVLQKAAKAEGPLKIQRHLNLIRNYTAAGPNKRKLNVDVEVMKKLYAAHKKKHGPTKAKSKGKKKTKTKSKRMTASKSKRKTKSKSKSKKKGKRKVVIRKR